MMKFILKVILNFLSTAWMFVIYSSHVNLEFFVLKGIYVSITISILTIVLSKLILLLINKIIEKESQTTIQEIKLADNEFLPVYLGYFFVAISINENVTFLFVYLIVFLFTFYSQDKYVNPTIILFNYHFYDATTAFGTHIFIIKKGDVISNVKCVDFNNLRRINDTTFIDLN